MSSACIVGNMVQSKSSSPLHSAGFWVWQAGAVEETQLHAEKFDFQLRFKRVLRLVWIFICLYLDLKNTLDPMLTRPIREDSSLNHTWMAASSALMRGMQKNKYGPTFGQI